MLYQNGNGKFEKLSEAMSEVDMDDESVIRFFQYIDTDKAADSTLLAKIKLCKDPNRFSWGSKFVAASVAEIKKKKDAELTRRFLLALYKLFGSEAASLYADIFRDYGDILKAALASEYPAEEVMPRYLIATNQDDYEDSAVLWKTVELADEENRDHVAFWCQNILSKEPIPQKEGNISEPAKKAVAWLENYFKDFTDMELEYIDAYRCNMLGIAAFFSKPLREFFSIAVNQTKTPLRSSSLSQRYSFFTDRYYEALMQFTQYVDKDYIYRFVTNRSDRPAIIQKMVERYTDTCISLVQNSHDAKFVMTMIELLKSVRPNLQFDTETVKASIRNKITNHIAKLFLAEGEVSDYLSGKISFAELLPKIRDAQSKNFARLQNTNYYEVFGLDDFAARCCIVLAIGYSNIKWLFQEIIDFEYGGHEAELLEQIVREKLSAEEILTVLNIQIENNDNATIDDTVKALEKYIALFDDVCTDNLSPTESAICIQLFRTEPAKHKAQLLGFTGSAEKEIRAMLVPVLAQADCHDDIVKLLSAKKGSVRELALSVIETMGSTQYRDALQKAFETEKTAKIKDIITKLLAQASVSEVGTQPVCNIEADIARLTDKSSSKKIDWVFERVSLTVHAKDGSDATQSILKALLMFYAPEAGQVNPLAEKMAALLDESELCAFANAFFGKWFEDGAPVKTKWVLYFAAVYGGNEIIGTLMECIRFWADNSRGSIAAEAVKALALNGSAAALTKVDEMSRKFKNKQVRAAATNALVYAAEQLGITKDELADRIVPDLGFDKSMCRIFDYGKRQFSVYLTAALDIEILNGEKKIKSMPKPGASDDAEMADKAYSDFKEMKKQLKTVVATQKERLEYVLMCNRKWTADNWKKLFISNPVMHCFAIGLIWGTYENDKLVSAFRYLDDGSFTTSDENEFVLADDAVIGLIHPIELTEQERSVWSEQLADYEIIQPFPQLSRAIFTISKAETDTDVLNRFNGNEIINQTLCGRLTKYNWEKGPAYDAGIFTEFYHKDISGLVRNADGTTTALGYVTELTFSGTYIGVFELEPEDVTIEEVRFYRADDCKHPIALGDVNSRYFSEILLQLTAALGDPEESET